MYGSRSAAVPSGNVASASATRWATHRSTRMGREAPDELENGFRMGPLPWDRPDRYRIPAVCRCNRAELLRRLHRGRLPRAARRWNNRNRTQFRPRPNGIASGCCEGSNPEPTLPSLGDPDLARVLVAELRGGGSRDEHHSLEVFGKREGHPARNGSAVSDDEGGVGPSPG